MTTASLSIRYLTGGVLARVNRHTQELEPELAESWKVSKDGKQITFKLRHGVTFSDGTPFSAEDVAFTMQRLMDPALHSSTGDAFRSGSGAVTTKIIAPDQVSITFPAPIAGLDRLFDQVAIMSAHSPKKEAAVLGPFMVAEYKAGSSVLLHRNPNYWKKDSQGRRLPYLDSIRLDIQPNRDVEMLRFKRGELDLINVLDSDYFDRLAASSPGLAHDAGAFARFRFHVVQSGGERSDSRIQARLVPLRQFPARDFSEPSTATISAAWSSTATPSPPSARFRPPTNSGSTASSKPSPIVPTPPCNVCKPTVSICKTERLFDKAGNPVEFSIVTNASSKARERMAVMVQEDLGKLGIKVNVVTLDFPSLIERISQKFNYEAAMLGFRNVDLDPNGQMNIWLSSAEDHAWNPQQKSPETAWEAEIDRLMRAQASTADPKKRKESFDRVQEIVAEQTPFIYLVNQNALSAVSSCGRRREPRNPFPADVLERRAPDPERNHAGKPITELVLMTPPLPNASATLLSAQVTVRYPGKAPVLRGISLEIARGEVVGLVGQSGSGKSTLALAILGLLGRQRAIVEGSIIFQGTDLLAMRERELRSLRGRSLSLVLQSPLASLNPALQIRTQLREAWRAHSDRAPQPKTAIKRSSRL